MVHTYGGVRTHVTDYGHPILPSGKGSEHVGTASQPGEEDATMVDGAREDGY